MLICLIFWNENVLMFINLYKRQNIFRQHQFEWRLVCKKATYLPALEYRREELLLKWIYYLATSINNPYSAWKSAKRSLPEKIQKLNVDIKLENNISNNQSRREWKFFWVELIIWQYQYTIHIVRCKKRSKQKGSEP